MEQDIIGFSRDACDGVSNTLVQTVYNPGSGIEFYNYKVYKNDEIIESENVYGNKSSTFHFNSTGRYYVEIYKKSIDGVNSIERSCEYKIDKDMPSITLKNDSFTVVKGKDLNVMDGVSATDDFDGDITSKIVTNIDSINLNKTGTKELTYTVSDTAGNEFSKSVKIKVTEDPVSLFISQGLLIFALLIAVAYILRYRHSLSLERRIEKYSINLKNDNRLSIFDRLHNFIYSIIAYIKNLIKNSVFLDKYSKRYDKYVGNINTDYNSRLDFVAEKILFGLVIVFIFAITKAVSLKIVSIYEICFPFIIGFFLPDILWISKYKIFCSYLENDFLQAIIIMNNAFKSGKSITQAIYLVTTELKGPISREFKRIYDELNLGLDVEEVFKRLSMRIPVEEVTYLTASLSIINKTGGNIIRVFDSIEKTLVDKKKLRLELNSLTSGSKIIVRVLFFVPVLFVIFVAILNPSYFTPLFDNPLGILLLVFMSLLYILYIVCVKWIMKVRM